MWPFRKKVPTRTSFPIGPYALGRRIKGFTGLIELSPAEYSVTPRHFKGERIYKAPSVHLAGCTWKVMISAVHGEIYKLAPYLEVKNKKTASIAARKARSHCKQKLGKPLTQRPGLAIWNTIDGNVILQTTEAADGFAINIFARSHYIRNCRRLGSLGEIELSRTLMMQWNSVERSQPDRVMWSWLRSIEWGRWPIFLSQSLAPLFLLFFSWKAIVIGSVGLNLLWAGFIRYHFVSIRAAYWGALIVGFKWLTCPLVAIYLYLSGEKTGAVFAFLWPLLIFVIGVLPRTQIGKIQDMFMAKLGYERWT